MNYADLFRVTLPETILEIAAVVVLIVDLAFLRKSAQQLRTTSAAFFGIIGCAAAAWYLPLGVGNLNGPDGLALLSTGGAAACAQIAILALTGLCLALLVETLFTRHVGEFVAVMLMSAAGGLIIAAAQDLIVIFIGLELLSLGLYILTAFAKKSAKSAEAAIKYYLFGAMSAAFLLFGFSYLYGLTGSTNLQRIAQHSYFQSYFGAAALLDVALVMVAAGLGFKIAAVPFQLWAPDTYEGAPAPAAAFVASVSKVASFALLISVGTAALHVSGHYAIGQQITADVPEVSARHFGMNGPWWLLLAVLSVASMIVGNLAALAQSSVRRLVAYSAVAHAGYVLLGLAFFSYSALSARAVLYYILTYGLTTIGAFGVVAVVERATGSDRMDSFLSLHKRNPVLAAVLLVFFLSLAGIPPLVGFWAKFNLFAAVLAVGAGPVPFALVALAVAFSAVSLYYYLQVLKRAYVMPGPDESPIRAHPVTMIVLVFIAVAVVVLGCFPSLLGDWIASFYSLG
ncbi:MAG TPA: NADH-quinone oxidoreductase subunit N [Terracidiphilus sp.]|nr:NADH-quinone oxidoreductase subunit N [Terracidiphilus sp.]